MLYKKFGQTGIKMPAITCGCMRFQQGWEFLEWDKIDPAIQDNLEKTVWHAFENGVTHFETARGYGPSELQLGHVLPDLPRNQIIIQSKIGPMEDPKEFEHALEDSLRRLNTGYLDLFAFHGLNDQASLDSAIKKNGCMDVALRWKEKGLIRHIGFSTHADGETVVQAINTGLFSFVNLHFYYIRQTNRIALEAAEKRNMGVLIISPNDKGGKLYEPPAKLVDLTSPFSPMIYNDLFCLNTPNVHTISIGVSKPQDLDEHIRAASLLENEKEKINAITEKLNNEMVRILGSEWANNWEKGLPWPEKAQDQTAVRTILWLLNLAKTYDLIEYGKMRYNLLGNGGHWFPGNKVTDLEDPELEKIITNSPFKDKIPGLLAEADNLFKGAEIKRLHKED